MTLPPLSEATPALESVLVYNLVRTHAALAPLLDADLRQQAPITATQFNALLALQTRAEDGLTMGELGRQLVVSKSNVTGLVDRLERGGWARRFPATDRRATCVRITPAGAALLRQTAPAHAAALADLTAVLTDTEKEQLTHLLTKLRRALRHRRREAE